MTSDSNIRQTPGRRRPPAWPALGPGGPKPQAAARRQAQLARLTARQFRRAPGVPGSWSRFLVAHVRWILVVTLAAVAGAAALAHSQTPTYSSQSQVYVGFSAAAGTGTLQAPDMATEKGVASSGVVLSRAAHVLHVSTTTLEHGLSVNVPASTYLLQISYSDANPRVARTRAEAITRAYIRYRSPGGGTKNAAGVTVITTPKASLLSAATLPSSPSSPKYLIDIGVALLIGLILGIGTAALRDHLDDRPRGPADVEEQAEMPVLGLIPAFRRSRRKPARSLVMISSPASVVAEAYRNLRTRIVQVAADRGAKTVLVTSPGWEDKSVVAANLAVALAQAGHSTILVCGDLRWGHAHELLGVENRGGLTRMLSRRSGVPPVVKPTSVRGLRVVPPGSPAEDPAALLQRPAWHTVIGQLRRQADLVVIEAPPLLTTPDASVLAEVTEMVLLVVDARGSTRAQLRTAARELEPDRGKLIGCVLDNTGHRQWLPRPPRHPEVPVNGRAAAPLPRHEYAPSGAERISTEAASTPSAGGNGRVPASFGVTLGDTRGDDQ